MGVYGITVVAQKCCILKILAHPQGSKKCRHVFWDYFKNSASGLRLYQQAILSSMFVELRWIKVMYTLSCRQLTWPCQKKNNSTKLEVIYTQKWSNVLIIISDKLATMLRPTNYFHLLLLQSWSSLPLICYYILSNRCLIPQTVCECHILQSLLVAVIKLQSSLLLQTELIKVSKVLSLSPWYWS